MGIGRAATMAAARGKSRHVRRVVFPCACARAEGLGHLELGGPTAGGGLFLAYLFSTVLYHYICTTSSPPTNG
jgi:hypothetical protein